MPFNKLIKIYEQNPDVKLWYRDDDVTSYTDERLVALTNACIFVVQNHVDGLFGVIPNPIMDNKNSLAMQILRSYGVKVGMHGITHAKNAVSGGDSEFPEEYRNEEYEKLIPHYFSEFKDTFGSDFMPIFIAPFNRYSPYWENIIKKNGFKAISAANYLSYPQSDFSIDIDLMTFINGKYGYLEHEKIIEKVIDAIGAGKKRIGILNHHWVGDPTIWSFLKELFAIFRTDDNVATLQSLLETA